MRTITDVWKMRLAWAVLGIVAVLTCGSAVQYLAAEAPGWPFLGVAAYLAAWIPFVAALAATFWGESFSRAMVWLGLRFRALDVLWGIGIGCLVRAVDAAVRLTATGSTGLVQQPTLSALGSPPAETIAWGIVAPVIIAPILEELYFRGLMQRTLGEALARFGSVARWAAAVVLTSVVFAAVHALLLLATPGEALLTGISTLVFALAAGTTAAVTGRLGGAIVGHVMFNGLGVLLTWPL